MRIVVGMHDFQDDKDNDFLLPCKICLSVRDKWPDFPIFFAVPCTSEVGQALRPASNLICYLFSCPECVFKSQHILS